MKEGRMSFDDFKNQLTNMQETGEFSFGFNWLDYVKTRLNNEIIEAHVNDLKTIYDKAGIDLKNKSVFDIGCGSGLSSLSFAKLGASKIVGIDVDPYSVEASNYTKDNFLNNRIEWDIHHHSILSELLHPEQSFDIVYSWGVLHHTGDMWNAIRNAVKNVRVGGFFHVALYRSGPTYNQHLTDKFKFTLASMEEKMSTLYNYKHLKKNPWAINNRGMNKFHDALDWLGGLPYEVCDPEVLNIWLSKYGFDPQPVYFTDNKEGGNFITILKRFKG